MQGFGPYVYVDSSPALFVWVAQPVEVALEEGTQRCPGGVADEGVGQQRAFVGVTLRGDRLDAILRLCDELPYGRPHVFGAHLVEWDRSLDFKERV